MRCWCFLPDNRFALSITAPWWSHKKPRDWSIPANDNWSTDYVGGTESPLFTVAAIIADDMFHFTPEKR